MKILLLNDSFPPLIDGVANVVLNYASILTGMGANVMVVTPSNPDAADDYPFEVVRYKSMDTTKLVGYRTGFPFDAEALERLEAFQPDIIHVHCPIVSLMLARVLRQLTGAPIVFTYHTKFDIEVHKYISSRFLQDGAIHLLADNISCCDEIWAVSRGAAENLRSLGYTGPCRIMENGVDLPKARAPKEAAAEISHAYGIPEGIPVFLFVGRMQWYKGNRITLDALRGVTDAGYDYRMFFVGDGADLAEMKAYTDELSLSDKVIFTGAIRDREVLRAFYTRADLFLFPSTFDTNGIVVREAAACGLGSLLVRGSCAAEGITHLENGVLAEENPVSMRDALIELLKKPGEFRRIGENAGNQIYIPWSKSVALAYERYRIICQHADRGEYQPPENFSENFFEMYADFYTSMEKLRELQRDIITLRQEFRDMIEEHLEDHPLRRLKNDLQDRLEERVGVNPFILKIRDHIHKDRKE
ncbi:MAG: glycosyltransferase [Clostridia bacterium]|nr:glycosyltransferase [Clostridia bacterium]